MAPPTLLSPLHAVPRSRMKQHLPRRGDTRWHNSDPNNVTLGRSQDMIVHTCGPSSQPLCRRKAMPIALLRPRNRASNMLERSASRDLTGRNDVEATAGCALAVQRGLRNPHAQHGSRLSVDLEPHTIDWPSIGPVPGAQYPGTVAACAAFGYLGRTRP